MRDLLDALETIQTNKKKPMDVKKELNKKPAVMKALSLEDEHVDEVLSSKGRANLRKMISDFERMAEEMNLSQEAMDAVAMGLDQIMADVQEIEGVSENKTMDEDKFDGYKIHRLGELQKKVDEVAKDIRLLGKTDSVEYATGAGDLTDQITTMNKAVMMLQDVIERANSIVPDPMHGKTESKVDEDPKSTFGGGDISYDQFKKGQPGKPAMGFSRQSLEKEINDWVKKYEDFTGVNGDSLPEGYLEATLKTGIMSDAYDQDEYMAFNKKMGYENDGEWKPEDYKNFMLSSPNTKGMFDEIAAIQNKYGIDEEGVNDIMGYFDKMENRNIKDHNESQIDEGTFKQAQIEIQDWAEKYNKFKGTNADPLAHGYLQAMLNTGIMSDAYEENEVEAFNKMKGYGANSNDAEWAEGDHEDFTDNKSGVSPITAGMFSTIGKILGKYGLEDDDVNDALGYFEAKGITRGTGKKDLEKSLDKLYGPKKGIKRKDETINSEVQEMETTKKDTVEVAVEDLARVLELAGLGKETLKAEAKMDAHSADMEKHIPMISKMRDELMDKGMEPEDAFDKACDKYGFDPDDVSEYMDKKNEATEEATIEAPNEVELDEYSNSPDEHYSDADTQLNKLSGGINGPKKQFKKEYPGDNPLAVDLEQKLAKMLSDM